MTYKINKLITIVICIIYGMMLCNAQSSATYTEDKYEVENAVLRIYYPSFMSEQGSLASPSMQKEFRRRGFHLLEIPEDTEIWNTEHLRKHEAMYFRKGLDSVIENPVWDGYQFHASNTFNLRFNKVTFLDSNTALVYVNIDFGNVNADKIFKIVKENGEWLFDDIALTTEEPYEFFTDFVANAKSQIKRPSEEVLVQ